MKNSKMKQCVIAAVFAVFSFGVAVAQVPDSLKNAWENPDLREKIDAGIKANRMGMFTLKFDGNVENVKVELVRHEFLFGFYASRAACEGKVYQKNTEAEIAKFFGSCAEDFQLRNYCVCVAARRARAQQDAF